AAKGICRGGTSVMVAYVVWGKLKTGGNPCHDCRQQCAACPRVSLGRNHDLGPSKCEIDHTSYVPDGNAGSSPMPIITIGMVVVAAWAACVGGSKSRSGRPDGRSVSPYRRPAVAPALVLDDAATRDFRALLGACADRPC